MLTGFGMLSISRRGKLSGGDRKALLLSRNSTRLGSSGGEGLCTTVVAAAEHESVEG